MIPNGSDAPVELVNPYHGIYAAVTRTNRLGEPKGGWHIEEAMTREGGPAFLYQLVCLCRVQ